MRSVYKGHIISLCSVFNPLCIDCRILVNFCIFEVKRSRFAAVGIPSGEGESFFRRIIRFCNLAALCHRLAGNCTAAVHIEINGKAKQNRRPFRIDRSRRCDGRIEIELCCICRIRIPIIKGKTTSGRVCRSARLIAMFNSLRRHSGAAVGIKVYRIRFLYPVCVYRGILSIDFACSDRVSPGRLGAPIQERITFSGRCRKGIKSAFRICGSARGAYSSAVGIESNRIGFSGPMGIDRGVFRIDFVQANGTSSACGRIPACEIIPITGRRGKRSEFAFYVCCCTCRADGPAISIESDCISFSYYCIGGSITICINNHMPVNNSIYRL